MPDKPVIAINISYPQPVRTEYNVLLLFSFQVQVLGRQSSILHTVRMDHLTYGPV